MASSTYCPIWIADNAKSSGNTQIAGLSLSASSLSQYALKYIVESASTLKRAVFDERAVTDVVRPNATTYLDTNLPFLFLQETTATTALCSSCASAIMIAYMSWETKAPYAAGGVGKSPTLANQFALYEAMTKQCPASFVATVNSSVTGQTNPTSGALSASPVPAFAAVVVGALATVFLI
jgi:hypothetical protein